MLHVHTFDIDLLYMCSLLHQCNGVNLCLIRFISSENQTVTDVSYTG